jgi:hypothetical protein
MMQTNCPLSRARQVFSNEWARIEQAGMQRRPIGIIEMRQMEFEAVRKIAKVLGVTL